MKNYIDNNDKKDMQLDCNGNVIYLLTTWEDGSPNAWEDANKLANAATAWAWRYMLFNFNGARPASAADFFDELPYTSTSSFAAVWNVSRDVTRADNSALHLKGVALGFVNDYTAPRAVFLWREYNADGDEVRDVYEVAGDCPKNVIFGTFAEIKQARAEVGAELKQAREAMTADTGGVSWRERGARVELLRARAAILRANERAEVARLARVALADVLPRYNGKHLGKATGEKLREDFRRATGGALCMSWGTAWGSPRVRSVRVQKLSPEGYTTANGEAVELYARNGAGGGYNDFVDANNIITYSEQIRICTETRLRSTAWTADEADALRELRERAENAISTARELVREYNDRAPDGVDELGATL